MSMLLMLLNREVPDLPGGKAHKHVCLSAGVERFRMSQKNVQEKNIEAVFNAIAGGARTNHDMQEATGLSKACCHNACCTLLAADRVYVCKGHARHAYYVKGK